ncbi:radical SAM family heme chaperone HemW [Gammaproteobacteria bacterium]|nr:radical SAM family heme chaperone HemW [Gammaproteobacteria bacterium]MDC1190638.1 radical SAM family heme chaperone HemW [Gammaproteobacteria bacterium]
MKVLDLNKIPISLYIHFPWCEKKCPYCDFNIETNKKDGDEEHLLRAILEDLDTSYAYLKERKFKSLYFGGGTPSLVSVKIVEKIISRLHEQSLLADDCEVSFELNPKEVTKDYLDALVNIGINRFSVGIQSFSSNTLASLERNHNSKESIDAVELVSSMKHADTTIDLIYGVMEQDLSSLTKDIEIFCSYDIGHLSMYQLTIEPNTIFYKKELKLPQDTLIESMENEAKKILNKNNISQYEVSSWSKEYKQSKHNMNYWMYGDYLGLGPGAHSKITTEDGIKRMIKLKKLNSYIKNPSKTSDIFITKDTYDLDLAMNLLRIKNGLSLDEIKQRHIHLPKSFMDKRQIGIEQKLLEKDRFKATQIGYKFLNDTINLFN